MELSTKRRQQRGSIAGPVLGILAFLAGIGLLALTFKLAIDMFGIEPAKLFDLQPGKTLDINMAGATLMGVIVKVLLLLVMAVVGGVIASRGIHLYSHGRSPVVKVRKTTDTAAD